MHLQFSDSRLLFSVNASRPTRSGHHFGDDAIKCIFLNENISISIKISLKFVPKGPLFKKTYWDSYHGPAFYHIYMLNSELSSGEF